MRFGVFFLLILSFPAFARVTCGKEMNPAAFRALSEVPDEVTGHGWRKFDLPRQSDLVATIQRTGHQIALLVRGNAGKELVIGYVYEVKDRDTLVVSLRPPRFELDLSEGRTRYQNRGWGRRPNPQFIVEIPFEDIAQAKYYFTWP